MSFPLFVFRLYLENKTIIDVIDIFVLATGWNFIIFIVVIFTTVITSIKLQTIVTWRQKSLCQKQTAVCSKEIALTKMLIAESVLFITCMTPNVMMQIAVFVSYDLTASSSSYVLSTMFWQLVKVMKCINPSVNFFIYFAMGTRFREMLFHTIRYPRINTPLAKTTTSTTSAATVNNNKENRQE